MVGYRARKTSRFLTPVKNRNKGHLIFNKIVFLSNSLNIFCEKMKMSLQDKELLCLCTHSKKDLIW